MVLYSTEDNLVLYILYMPFVRCIYCTGLCIVYVLYSSLYGVCIVQVLIWCMYCTGPYMVYVL